MVMGMANSCVLPSLRVIASVQFSPLVLPNCHYEILRYPKRVVIWFDGQLTIYPQ